MPLNIKNVDVERLARRLKGTSAEQRRTRAEEDDILGYGLTDISPA